MAKKEDKQRKAKPKGYRFTGDNTKRPLVSERGDSDVYFEGRKDRSDKNLTKKLEEGGETEKWASEITTIDEAVKFINAREDMEKVWELVKIDISNPPKWLYTETSDGSTYIEKFKTDESLIKFAEEMRKDKDNTEGYYAKGGKPKIKPLTKEESYSFWNYDYRHYMRDASFKDRERVYKKFISEGLELGGNSPKHTYIVVSIIAPEELKKWKKIGKNAIVEKEEGGEVEKDEEVEEEDNDEFKQGGNIDKDIKAKPKGYRFTGDNYKRPLVSERGDSDVYFEARKNRSDKNLTKKLEGGGSMATGGGVEDKYTVWVGGGEVNDHALTKEEAETLANEYKEKGYDDVVIEQFGQGGKIASKGFFDVLNETRSFTELFK